MGEELFEEAGGVLVPACSGGGVNTGGGEDTVLGFGKGDGLAGGAEIVPEREEAGHTCFAGAGEDVRAVLAELGVVEVGVRVEEH